MKRRFEETLLAVAIAALGVAATAMAPTIFNIKSPVIGTGGAATQSNVFVYPDALNVDELASDPDGTVADDAIIWSYTGMTDRYLINGVAQIDVATDNPVAPGSKQLDTQDLDSAAQVDNDPNTLSFRDATIDPIGGPVNADGLGLGIVASDLVTLFASDGTTYSSKSFYVYTDNGGEDRLSGSSAENVGDWNFVGNANGWISTADFGSPTFSTAGGLCVDAGVASQDAWGSWISPSGIFDLSANSVYRLRMVVEGAGQAPGTTPLWTVVLDNNNNTGTGDNKWGAEWFFLDNENGINAPQTTGRSEFLLYWNPMPITDAAWNDATTGMFTPARVSGGNNAARLIYRILDVNGAVPGGDLDGGQVCLKQLTIDKIDYSDMSSGVEVYNKAVTAADFAMTPPNGILGTTTATFAGGAVTLTPTDGNWELEVDTLDMGDNVADLTNPSTLIDNYPILWESDQILKTTARAESPNATADTNPVDVVRMQNDTPTNEILMYNLVVSTANTLGLPTQAAPVDYVSFFYTHTETASGSPGLDRVRSRVVVINTEAISSGGSANNAGGITFSNVKVETVVDPTL